MVNVGGSGGEIMQRWDGNGTVAEILMQLQDSSPGDHIEKDVYNFIGHAYDNGWLKSA